MLMTALKQQGLFDFLFFYCTYINDRGKTLLPVLTIFAMFNK